jgi:GxxExxY protein
MAVVRVGTAIDSSNDTKLIRVEYKGLFFDEPLRFDLLIDDWLLIELKAVEILHPSSKAQLLSYLRFLDIPIG